MKDIEGDIATRGRIRYQSRILRHLLEDMALETTVFEVRAFLLFPIYS